MSRLTVFPAREIVLIARHATIGREKFCEKIDRALLELIAGPCGCDMDRFTAGNGVELTIMPVPQIEPSEIQPGDDAGESTDLPDQRIELALQTATDTTDSLDAIHAAVQDGDYSEALRLINIAKESLNEHIEVLRERL